MSQIQVELQEWLGSDRSVAEAAWTSSLTLESKEKRTEEDVERIVRMLIESGHSSPIEAVVMRFWIKMPITADRQHVTHRIASHNGMSGRYRTMPDEWLHVPNDIKTTMSKTADLDGYIELYETQCRLNNDIYREMLERFKNEEKKGTITNKDYKRLREFFRGVLPQNNMTERVTIFNLRSFANYMKLRNSEEAQPEIRKVAELMLREVKSKKVCPVAIKVLEENKWDI